MKNPETGEPASGTAKMHGENKPAPEGYIKWCVCSPYRLLVGMLTPLP